MTVLGCIRSRAVSYVQVQPINDAGMSALVVAKTIAQQHSYAYLWKRNHLLTRGRPARATEEYLQLHEEFSHQWHNTESKPSVPALRWPRTERNPGFKGNFKPSPNLICSLDFNTDLPEEEWKNFTDVEGIDKLSTACTPSTCQRIGSNRFHNVDTKY